MGLVLGLAIGVFAVVVALGGESPSAVLLTLGAAGTNSTYGLAEAVVKSIPVLLCALAAAIPGRLGLVNIGGEGQLLLGAIGAALAAQLALGLPLAATLILMTLFAAVFGSTWGLLPGILRGLTRANEIVISLLLNYVAGLMLLHLIHGPWKDPASLGWPQGVALAETARLPGLAGTRIHPLIWVALALCGLLAFAARRTVAGMAARVIAANPTVGRYLGLRVPAYYVVAFAVAGAIAGLAGFGELSGIQGRLREGLSLGYGYAGFFVAWLCRNHFPWLPVGALAFSIVITGADALQVSAGMPFATVYLLQGLVFLAILAAVSLEREILRRWAARGGAA
jgi:simple sugar transport system permease protein